MADVSHSSSRLALKGLEENSHQFIRQGISETTRRCYNSGMKRFKKFYIQFSLPYLPTLDYALFLYVTSMGKENVSVKTIRLYLSAIRYFHISKSLRYCGISPRIELLLKGIAI